MGQTQLQGVRSVLPPHLAQLTDRLVRNAAEIKQTASLTYEQFIESLVTLTELASRFSDAGGKQLVFLVKKGTDDSVLWRATVRIKCYKVNRESNAIESTRILTLKQYIRLYNEITRHATSTDSTADDTAGASMPSCLDASVLLTGLDTAEAAEEELEKGEECIICMDRKSQIMLPCSHSYCEQCIDSWQGSHRNCPVCRATVNNAKESWILPEKPSADEMTNETNRYVMDLIDRYPTIGSGDSDTE